MFALIAIVFGLCIGSFLNVLIIRIPKNKSVILPPSSCTSCGNRLRAYHNIPVISYIILMGRCAFCKARISPIYPIVEIISGILAYAVYLKFGYSISTIFVGIGLLLLFALSVMDFRTMQVPDNINFSALLFCIIGSLIHTGNFLYVVGSSLSFAGFLTLLRFAMQSILKKDVMGEGDIIVMATIAALLGWELSFVSIFLSSLFALIIMLIFCRKDAKVPFIPFLFLGMLPCLFFPDFFNMLLDSIFKV